jgi:hypothetical protein
MTQDEEIKDYLISNSPDFRRLAHEHHAYEAKLEAIRSSSHVTEAQELEEINLKKLKLNLKDQMNQLIQEYRHEHAQAQHS